MVIIVRQYDLSTYRRPINWDFFFIQKILGIWTREGLQRHFYVYGSAKQIALYGWMVQITDRRKECNQWDIFIDMWFSEWEYYYECIICAYNSGDLEL